MDIVNQELRAADTASHKLRTKQPELVPKSNTPSPEGAVNLENTLAKDVIYNLQDELKNNLRILN